MDAEASELPQRSKKGLAVIYDDTDLSIEHVFARDEICLRRRTPDGQILEARIPRGLCSTDATEEALRVGMRKCGMNEYEIERMLHPVTRASTANNEVNTLMGINPFADHYTELYGRSAQNAYAPPPKFPRSEATQDDIMIRRVNARLKLAQDKRVRHYQHIGIGIAAAFVLPWLVAFFCRSWGFCMAWIAT